MYCIASKEVFKVFFLIKQFLKLSYLKLNCVFKPMVIYSSWHFTKQNIHFPGATDSSIETRVKVLQNQLSMRPNQNDEQKK